MGIKWTAWAGVADMHPLKRWKASWTVASLALLARYPYVSTGLTPCMGSSFPRLYTSTVHALPI